MKHFYSGVVSREKKTIATFILKKRWWGRRGGRGGEWGGGRGGRGRGHLLHRYNKYS